MDTNNWRPAQAEPNMDVSGDWRTQLQPDSRQRIVNKIMETLKRHLPFSGQEGLHELKKIAIRFEEKIYTAATSQADYLRKISLKMLTMESKSQNPMVGSVPSSGGSIKNPPDSASQMMQGQMHNQAPSLAIPSACNQTQPRQQLLSQNIQNNIVSAGPVQSSSSLQSGLTGLSQSPVQNVISNGQTPTMQNSAASSMGQGVPSNVFAHQQRQLQGSRAHPQQIIPQQPQQQQQQRPQNQYIYQQLLNNKYQQGDIPQSMMQQSLLQLPNEIQPSQQSGLALQQNQQSSVQSVLRQQQQQPQQSMLQSQQHQLIGQQNSMNMQQNQLIGQQNSTSMQQNQLIGQQNSTSMQQNQLLGQQNNLSNIHQQQLGSQNNVSGLPRHQQQHLLGSQPATPAGQANQHAVNLLQQSKMQGQQQTQHSPSNLLPAQPQHQQLMAVSHIQSQPAKLQQQLGLQQNQPNALQQRLQANSGLLQQQNVIDQQKQFIQSQRPLPEASATSLDSQAQTGRANGGDWQEEAYQKLKAMREMYLPDLNDLYRRVNLTFQQQESLPQQPKLDQLEKLRLFKTMLEKLINYLQTPKNNILPGFKEKMGSHEKQIISFLNQNRSRKPISSLQQVQQHMHSSIQQPQQQQSQISQVQPQIESQMNSQQLQSMNLQQNSVSSITSLSGLSNNMMNNTSIQPSANLDSTQGNSLSTLQNPQQGQSGVNTMLQPNMNSLQPNSNILQHQHLKQQQEQQLKQQFQQRQVHQQLMQQKLQQQQQQQQLQQSKQMSQIHQMSGSKTGSMFQQQRLDYQQQLKSGSPFPISPQQLIQAASPKIPQHSPQIDQQNLLSSVTKSGTPLQCANSPFVVPSPSTPLAPSPMPGDNNSAEKVNSSVPLLPNTGNTGAGPQQAVGGVATAQSLAIGTPGISASPLLAEFSGLDGILDNASTISGKSGVTGEKPLERLIKVVKSMSPKALSASVSEIGSVVSMIDRIAGSAPGNGSRAAVGEDLVAMTKCRLQARNFITQDGNMSTTTTGSRKMRRYTSAMQLNVVSSPASANYNFKHLIASDGSELESTVTSNVKRPRLMANHALMEEIRVINQQLIDTVIDIADEDVDPMAVAAVGEGGEGTIVKCSFNAVALGPNFKSQYASAQMSPIQPLQLLVPTNYPNCSPILLDKFPVEVSKEFEDLSAKAKSRFSISLRSLSEPMSLEEIARTWDMCARAIISDYAQQSGGGSFSSKYGTWENCLSAA